MRKMPWMQDLPRYTVTYCQYGDKRMKPTDIWTNYPRPNFKPPCSAGDKCHMAAPRGSSMRKAKKRGIDLSSMDISATTYGMRKAKDRSKIPEKLCEHIVNICEGNRPELPQLEWRFDI